MSTFINHPPLTFRPDALRNSQEARAQRLYLRVSRELETASGVMQRAHNENLDVSQSGERIAVDRYPVKKDDGLMVPGTLSGVCCKDGQASLDETLKEREVTQLHLEAKPNGDGQDFNLRLGYDTEHNGDGYRNIQFRQDKVHGTITMLEEEGAKFHFYPDIQEHLERILFR